MVQNDKKSSMTKTTIDWNEWTIGNNPETSNFVVSMPVGPGAKEHNFFEVKILFQQGRYWLVNSPLLPLKDLFVRLSPNSGEICLRPDDSIKLGSVELKVCRFNVGVAETIGDRPFMEDKMEVIQDMNISSRLDISLFAVFDGHGEKGAGKDCSRFVCERLPQTIKNKMLFDERSKLINFDTVDNVLEFMKSNLEASCRIVDNEFLKAFQDYSQDRGSTCVMAIVVGDRLICANVGDSRALLSRNKQVIQLSRDHKPSDHQEAERMREAQGIISGGRLISEGKGGSLSISRSFGDFYFKPASYGGRGKNEDILISHPEIRDIQLDFVTDEFILLACDGLFEVLTNQQVVDFVNNRMAEMPIGDQDTQKVAEELVQYAFEQNKRVTDQSDNISCIIVPLTRAILKSDH